MTAIRLLTAAECAAYQALRRMMLQSDPWAFDATIDDDVVATDTALHALLARTDDDLLIITHPESSTRLIGAVGVVRRRPVTLGHRALIWGFYVDPDFRGAGHGRALLEAAIQHAAVWPGIDSIGLSVSTRSDAALALYESAGFVAWGREPECVALDGQRYDEVHLVYSVPGAGGSSSSAS